MLHGPTAHDVAHNRIDAQPLGVVGVLVTGQPAVDRLTQQRDRTVLDVANEVCAVVDNAS